MNPPNLERWQQAGAELQAREYLDVWTQDPVICQLITELVEIWRLKAIQLERDLHYRVKAGLLTLRRTNWRN